MFKFFNIDSSWLSSSSSFDGDRRENERPNRPIDQRKKRWILLLMVFQCKAHPSYHSNFFWVSTQYHHHHHIIDSLLSNLETFKSKRKNFYFYFSRTPVSPSSFIKYCFDIVVAVDDSPSHVFSLFCTLTKHKSNHQEPLRYFMKNNWTSKK